MKSNLVRSSVRDWYMNTIKCQGVVDVDTQDNSIHDSDDNHRIGIVDAVLLVSIVLLVVVVVYTFIHIVKY